jgi:signal transduction histidine kinase
MSQRVSEEPWHEDREQLLRRAAVAARGVAGADVAFAAVQNPDGAYPMNIHDGLHHPGWAEMCIAKGRGLGGQVLSEVRARAIDDYVNEPTITADWKLVAEDEGLRGMICSPVSGPDGTGALLYVAYRSRGTPGDRAVDALQRVSDLAAVGLYQAASRMRERELAVLRERQRIASALHDSVAQSLFAIGVAAEQSRRVGDAARIQEQLETIEAIATRARSELREALARLNAAPDGLALETRLEAELRVFERRTGRHVWITRQGEPRTLDERLENVLVDSFREGLTNAAKHGAGAAVVACVSYQAEQVLLSVQSEIRDRNRELAGPRGEPPISPGSGLGLLRNRARQLGGELSLNIDDDGTAALRIEVIT